MSTTTPTLPSAASRVRNPERVAWGVMLIAFAVFCLTCVLSLVVVYSFFFLSTVPMISTVQVARGTISLTGSDLREETVRESRDFLIGNVARPTPQSQTLIVFRDPYDANRIFATITLDEAISSASLQSAARPRFEWSNAGYKINLTQVQGNVGVFVADGFGDDLIIDLQTTQGSWVSITGSGEYSLRSLEDTLRVVNQRGKVLLIDPSLPREKSAKDIPPGYQGIAQAGASEVLVVEDGYDELLPNARFEQTVGDGFPLDWRCSHIVEQPPSGRYFTAAENGRLAIFMVRGEGTVQHGETYCEQGTREDEAPNWLPVMDYDYLALTTTLFVNYQSLNRCGTVGSECPLMLRIKYVDINGDKQELIYGFYTVNQPVEKDYPLSCTTCATVLHQDHIFIREKTWYSHSTGNLLNILPAEQRPAYITSVRFYASGHQYDTRVSELSLLGGYLDQMSPTINVVEGEIES